MALSGQYGRSFANKLIQDGKYDEAIESASKAITLEDDNPEHYADRAAAFVLLGRDAEAVTDFVRALELDEAAQVLETDLIDDAYFSALLAVARTQDVAAGCRTLAGYAAVLPKGRHLADADSWARRLRGELKSEFVKVREVE
jgi:tetratricopeptide (TPR) repeat protein